MKRSSFGFQAVLGVALLANVGSSDALAQDHAHRAIRVSLTDRSIEAIVLNKRKAISPKQDRDYFWCIGQRIVATQGGVSGDVLDGPYTEYHPNGQLMTKGWLSKGLRTGSWLEWDEQGRLLRSTGWKDGRKHGRSLIMDMAGGEPTGQRYRNGKLIEPKKDKRELKERKGKQPDLDKGPTDKPIAKNKERPPRDAKDKGMSKRMRARNEQNKGTKEEVVRKRKDEKREQSAQPVTP